MVGKQATRRAFERYLLLGRFSGIIAQKFSKLGSVLGILMDPELQVLAECRVEHLEVVLVIRNFTEEIQAPSDNILADDLDNLVLLEGLTRYVKRKVIRVDDTLDEVEVVGDEGIEVVHDTQTTDQEPDIVALVLGLEGVEGVERCPAQKK